ncbi:MAG: MurR/RpiR family transcriptional regulator [Anaerostipes hadrus]
MFGKGDSRISLENFKNKMIKLNEYFIIGDEYQNNFYTVGNITSNDLVIFCTYSAMHHDYNSYLPVLKDHNVPIITVTSNIHSKLAVNSDIVLQLPDDESFDEKVASFASQTNMDFIFDYIYSIIFQKNYMENYHSKHAKDVYTNSMIYNKL